MLEPAYSYNYREKVKFLPPISCVSTRFDVSRSALEQKKLYIHTPSMCYVPLLQYLRTYILVIWQLVHNGAKSCLKLYFNKNAYDFMRYFSTLNLHHLRKIKKNCEIRDMIFLNHFKSGLNPLWCALGENKVRFKRFSTKKSTHSCLFRLVTGWFMIEKDTEHFVEIHFTISIEIRLTARLWLS